MAGNPWATATQAPAASGGTANPWATATAGGLADKLQVASASEHDEAGAAAFAQSPTGVVEQATDDVGGALEKIGSDMWSALTAPTPAPINTGFVTENNPTAGGQIITTGLNSYAASLKSAAASMSAPGALSYDPNESKTQNAAAVGGAVLGGINAFLAPITAASAAAAQIPVIGHVATWINNIFGAIGTGSADVGSYALQATPFLSQDQKDELDPLVKQASALAGQIAAGAGAEGAHEAFGGKIADITNKISDAIAVKNPVKDSTGQTITPNPIIKLPVEGDTTPRPLAVTDNSPAETAVTPNKGDGTSVEPIPQQTAPTDNSLPTIQANAEEPVANETTSAPSSSTAENGTPTTAPAVENAASTPTGDTPTKGALDINENLVKEAQEPLTPAEMASYKGGSYKDDAETGRILKEQDPEALKQMAITGKGIPEGVYPKILYNIVEKDAIDSKDYALQRELAGSPLHTITSEQAGGLGSSGYNKVSDSPVDVLRKAIDDRAGGTKGKEAITKEATKAKSTITKAAAKLMDYQDIIDKIKTC